MAQTLEEQLSTVERALGESMIEHALVIIRSWMNELGENNPYEEAYQTIQSQYQAFFIRWMNVNDPHAPQELNTLTGDTYQLMDSVYAAIRLHRGLSPDMHGFNPESPQSVMNYFANSIRLREQDIEWLHEMTNDEEHVSITLMAFNALTRCVRECFNIDAFQVLIDGMLSENEIIADQCMANVFTLIIHYDVRIDYFPQIQNALADTIAEMGDGGDHAFDVLCAMIRSVPPKAADGHTPFDEESLNKLTDALSEFLEKFGLKQTEDDASSMMAWVPKSEQEYMAGIIGMFPQTWLYEILVEGDVDREFILTQSYLRIGNRELMWKHPNYAESYFVEALRGGSTAPTDYINYAHCLLLKGDRMMAYENYKQARALCASPREFIELFRPDRHQLVDCGIPVEFIYLLEDRLLKADT